MFNTFTGAPEEILIEDPNSEQPEGTDEPDVPDDSLEIEDPNLVPEDSELPEEPDKPSTPEDTTGQAADWQKKFKDPQEMFDAFSKLEQSYNNIRPEFTRKSQELAELKKKAADPNPAQIQLPNEINTPDDVVELISAAVKLKTDEALAPMMEHAEKLEMENAINKVARGHEDFETHLPKMMEILDAEPFLWTGGTEKALEIAYSMSKAANVKSSVEAIIDKTFADKGKIQALKDKEASNRVKATPSQAPSSSPEDSIADDILAVSTAKKNIFL